MLLSQVGCEPVVISEEEQKLNIYTEGALHGEYVLRLAGPADGWSGITMHNEVVTTLGGEVTMTATDGRSPGSAMLVTWSDIGQFYLQPDSVMPYDHSDYGENNSSIVFRIRIDQAPASAVKMAVHCEYPCAGEISIANHINAIADGAWHDVAVPLRCFLDQGLQVSNVTTPFLLHSDGPMQAAVEDIRWEKDRAGENPHCSDFSVPREDIETSSIDLYTDSLGQDLNFVTYQANFPVEFDRAGSNAAWSANLSPNTNIGIQRTTPLDATGFDTATAALEFDLYLADGTEPQAELLIKVATNWPTLSDVRLFDEILRATPAFNEWIRVSIPLQTLFASQNDLALGNYVDLTSVKDMFVIEPIGGQVVASFDNIRWVK